MATALDDAPLLHGVDDVSVLDGGEAVSDDDAGPALPGLVQGRLDDLGTKHDKLPLGSHQMSAGFHGDDVLKQ